MPKFAAWEYNTHIMGRLLDIYAANLEAQARREAAAVEATKRANDLTRLQALTEATQKLAEDRAVNAAMVAKFYPYLETVGAVELLEDAQKIWKTGQVEGPNVFNKDVRLYIPSYQKGSANKDGQDNVGPFSYNYFDLFSSVVRKKVPRPLSPFPRDIEDAMNDNDPANHVIKGGGIEVYLRHEEKEYYYSTGSQGPGTVDGILMSYRIPDITPFTPRYVRIKEKLIGVATFEEADRKMVFPYYLSRSSSNPYISAPQFDSNRNFGLFAWFKPLPINQSKLEETKTALTERLLVFLTDPRFKHPKISTTFDISP